MSPERRILFICGLHRSGTSVLHRALSGHSQVSGMTGTGVPEDEGQHLQDVYPAARAHGGPGLFGLDPASYLDETSSLATAGNARRILQRWEPHWNPDARVVLEKSPPNLVRTRFLSALFPGSYFVVIVRHPIPVALATRKMMQRPAPIHTLLDNWARCHRRFEEDRARLDHVMVLRYEEFVVAPGATLSAIHRFVGLEPEMPTVEVRRDVNEPYFAEWNGLRRGLVGRWRVSRLAREFDPAVRHFGYRMDPPGIISLGDFASSGDGPASVGRNGTKSKGGGTVSPV